MDLLEDPNFKIKYQKHKLRVKLWESDFMEKYGRKPNKNDIRAADVVIREAYKIYWNLKTKALENTLTEITFTEDAEKNTRHNDISDILQAQMHTQNEKGSSQSCTVDTENNYLGSYLSKHESKSHSSKDEVNVKGVWGEHLNAEINSIQGDQIIDVDKSSFHLSQKMFKSVNLSKRNPRKSNSFSKLCIKSKQGNLDESNCPSNLKPLETNYNFDISSKAESLNSNLKVVCSEKTALTQPTNTIQQLINGCATTMYSRTLNEGWLSRCSGDSNSKSKTMMIHPFPQSNDSGFELSKYIDSFKESASTQILLHETSLSDDDYVCNSDSEEERKNKRVRNLKKIASDNDIQPVKRVCLTNDEIFSYNENIDKHILGKSLPGIDHVKLSDSVSKILSDEVITSSTTIHKYEKSNMKTNINYNENRNVIKNAVIEEGIDHVYNNDHNSDDVDNKKLVSQKITRTMYKDKTAHVSVTNVDYFDVPLSRKVSVSGDLINDFTHVLEPSNCQIEPTQSDKIKHHINKEKIKQKNAAVNLNTNFIRINLKKKIFVRGKRSFSFSKYKRNQWKQRKKELDTKESRLEFIDTVDKNNGLLCFKCKEIGHFAKQCKNAVDDGLLPHDTDADISSYPTLQEIEEITKLKTYDASCDCSVMTVRNTSVPFDSTLKSTYISICKEPEKFGKAINVQTQDVFPVYELEENGSVKDAPLELLEALRKFGHTEFRDGQEKAIMRILSGRSTLVTLATGSGKSLCYQLPAYMYAKKSRCITLVISPLVSLMNDQVSKIPDFLSAACLHTNQSPKLRAKILDDLKEGKLNILLISPETLVAGERSIGLGGIFDELPPIAFACIDEAHCISQWSHNFRPSYLMVCKVLKEKLGVTKILGLTATASKSTVSSMISILEIADGLAGVVSETPLPSNLHLTVSQDIQREEALVKLIRSVRFSECHSIIVYCTRREECTRIAGLLRVALQDFIIKQNDQELKNIKVSPIAEAYHAGLSAHRRKMVQMAFMNSKTRIIVATVAFGMGINKPNIRSVIHFNMPANFESYVQEIGRAGRDGLPAYCHLFINSKESSDEYELRRHINAKGLDRHTIRRLLQKIFTPCSCIKSIASSEDYRCPGHEVAFPIDETVKHLDISEEMIATLLCYLELHPKRFIKLLPPAYINAKILSYSGPSTLKLAAQSSPPLAMAIALSKKKGTFNEKSCTVEFPVIEIASAFGWNSGLVKNQLKKLEWISEFNKQKRSTISVKFDTLGFRVQTPGNLSNEELDEALESLSQRNQSQTTLSFWQVRAISSEMRKFSFSSIEQCLCSAQEVDLKSDELKNVIRSYFNLEDPLADISLSSKAVQLQNEDHIITDIRNLILSYKDTHFTGRSIARIFHGIQSPNFPALVWSRCRFWRAHLSEDFNAICRLATTEILKLK